MQPLLDLAASKAHIEWKELPLMPYSEDYINKYIYKYLTIYKYLKSRKCKSLGRKLCRADNKTPKIEQATQTVLEM